MGDALPARLAKQIAGRCCYGACPLDALDGSDHCPAHDAHERGRGSARQKRRRLRLAERGVCIVAGCGRKVGKRIRSGRVVLRRCARCGKADREAKRKRRRVTGSKRRVTVSGAALPPGRVARTKIERAYDQLADGRERTIERVVYRTRGGQTRESMDADGEADVTDALRLLTGHGDRLRRLREAEPVLGRVQRGEARALVADSLLRAVRLAASEAARLHPDGWKMVREGLLVVGQGEQGEGE